MILRMQFALKKKFLGVSWYRMLTRSIVYLSSSSKIRVSALQGEIYDCETELSRYFARISPQ